MPRGNFIVLEGIDGSGTTLQAGALSRALRGRGHEVIETHEPSDGAIGRIIRDRLAATAPAGDPFCLALLFAADRLDHVRQVIEPALARGATVVCDRYVMSSWAYQGLECDPDWVEDINRRAPWPDATVLLEVPAQVALERVERRAAHGGPAPEIFEIEPIQIRLARAYGQMFRRGDLRGLHVIDGASAPEPITAAILAICEDLGL